MKNGMKKIATLLLVAAAGCMQAIDIQATSYFRRIHIQAYKTDPTTHKQTWSIQTTNSAERGAKNEIILTSAIIESSIPDLLIFKNQPTYFFVYKNSIAAEKPIKSMIDQQEIQAAGNNPVAMIKADGTIFIATRDMYEKTIEQNKIALQHSQVVEEPMSPAVEIRSAYPISEVSKTPEISNCPPVQRPM